MYLKHRTIAQTAGLTENKFLSIFVILNPFVVENLHIPNCEYSKTHVSMHPWMNLIELFPVFTFSLAVTLLCIGKNISQ